MVELFGKERCKLGTWERRGKLFFLLLAVALVLEIVEGLDIGGRALVLNLADAGGVQVPLVLATATGTCSFC